MPPISLFTTACVQVQLEGSHNWTIFTLFVGVFSPQWGSDSSTSAVFPDSQDTVSSGFTLQLLNWWFNIYIFHQDWLEDQPLMNNASGTAHWNHWRELCSSRFPLACSCFNRSQRGREQQQTAPLPALYCYCWSCFQNAQRPTAGNTINYPDDSWWERTGTDSHVRDLLTDIGKERCGCV